MAHLKSFAWTPLLLAGLAAVTAPASAADVRQLSCPIEGMSAAERAGLDEHVRRQGPPEDPMVVALFRSTEACQTRHGWSTDVARLAIVHNLASVGQRVSREALEQRGVDVAPFERALLADRAAIEGARSENAADQFVAFYDRLDPALRRSVEENPAQDVAELLGQFLLFRAAVETSRADFAVR